MFEVLYAYHGFMGGWQYLADRKCQYKRPHVIKKAYSFQQTTICNYIKWLEKDDPY